MSSKNFFTPSSQEDERGLCSPPCSVLPNSWSSSFWRLVRFTGVSTATRQSRSPTPPPRTDFTPLPRSRNTLPVCVSGGTLSITRPSSVGTSSSPPSAATTMVIGTSQ